MKKKILGVIIIILGLGLISIPRLVIRNLDKATEVSLEHFENIDSNKIKQNDLESVDEEYFDFAAVEEISPTSVLLDPSAINQKLLIGQIVIPSIELNLTVFKGVTESSLLAGVGTMKQNQTMGEGNYSIAGHNSQKGALFYKLDQVKLGDVIKITDKDKIYEYTVYDTEIVSPTSLYMIGDKEAEKHGGPIISLMNCYYENGKNTGNRYFVLGELTNTIDYDSTEMNAFN